MCFFAVLSAALLAVPPTSSSSSIKVTIRISGVESTGNCEIQSLVVVNWPFLR